MNNAIKIEDVGDPLPLSRLSLRDDFYANDRAGEPRVSILGYAYALHFFRVLWTAVVKFQPFTIPYAVRDTLHVIGQTCHVRREREWVGSVCILPGTSISRHV